MSKPAKKAKPLPCPFCGVTPRRPPAQFGTLWSVRCFSVKCRVVAEAVGFSREAVLRNWNTRAAKKGKK